MAYSRKARVVTSWITFAAFVVSGVVGCKLVALKTGPVFFLLAVGLMIYQFVTFIASLHLVKKSESLQKGSQGL